MYRKPNKKKGFFYICYRTMCFCVTNQVCNYIIVDNLNSPIIANFVLLCFRSLIVHNLGKTQTLLNLVLNDVLLRDESGMYLHYHKQLQLSHLGKFRSIILPIIDRTQLALRTGSSRSPTPPRIFAYQKKHAFPFPKTISTLRCWPISLRYDCDY